MIMTKLSLTIIVGAVALSSPFVAAQSSVNQLKQAADIVEAVRAELAPDKRQAVYDVKAYNNNSGVLMLEGVVSDSLTARELRSRLAQTGADYTDSLRVMPYDNMGLVRLSAASLRTAGRHAAEMATQALMGMPVRILDSSSEWLQVQTPDGYISWAPKSSVTPKTPAEINEWRRSKRMIVSTPYQTRVWATPEATGPREVVSDLVLGCIVQTADKPEEVNGRIEVLLPDGRRGYVAVADLMPIEKWASQPFDSNLILDTAYSTEGTPYLWGGTSVKALDCSGLAKTAYYANGLILMRDASQQALTGGRIEAANWRSCLPGDLLFFGNPTTGRVTHVAIYDRDGNYVHSSGRVRRNSVDPDSEAYIPQNHFLHAVRISGFEGSKGIVRASNHPWYF